MPETSLLPDEMDQPAAARSSDPIMGSTRERRAEAPEDPPQPSSRRDTGLGISVRELDREFQQRFRVQEGVEGVIVSRVEPLSPGFDADIERGHIVLEVNRRPVRSVDDFRRLTAGAKSG